MLLYRTVRVIVAGGCRVLWRLRLRGLENVPKEGGFVLAPSHRSMMDIPWVALVTPRRIRSMGKESLFRIPVLGAIFTTLGGFPVARDGTDRKALRDAMKMLDAGEVLLVYPEGTRQRGPKIAPLEPGAAYLSLRTGMPIIPVGIAGAEEVVRSNPRRFPSFHHGALVVGAPIRPPERPAGGSVPRSEVEALGGRLREELQRLLDEAYIVRDGPPSGGSESPTGT